MEQPLIVARLGSGGMADVFLAMRRGIGGFVKLVVVKRLRTGGAMEADAVAMFQDEARISARLNHPNVVQTHEVGFDGEHYRLEMEYLDGQPLHRIMSRAKQAGRAIPAGVAVAVMREVLAGLKYAHELCDYDGSPLGIVHRDVSPQNIFVTYDGSVKLVDFGIAKVAGQAALTQLGMVKGKVRYMAPEQATGRPVDHRADVFAAGVVLWQLLVGRGYWGEADDLGIFHMLGRGEMPPGPRTVNPDVPEALDRICARALAYDPNDRFATAEELIDALAPNVSAGTNVRALGQLAAELFVDVRQSIRAEIEKAAARPVGDPDDEDETKVISMMQSSSSNEQVQFERMDGSERPVSQAVLIPERVRARSKGVAFLVAGLTGLLALAVVVLALRALQGAPASSRSSGAATAPLPVAPAVEPAAGPLLPGPPTDAAVEQPAADPKPGPRPAAAGAKGRLAQTGVRGVAVVATERPVIDAGAPAAPPDAGSKRPTLIGGDMWDAGGL